MTSRLGEPYDKPDETGLCPIHWAAIYNRPDKIESILNAGSSLRIKCSNKLLAHGTALHLAAVNGSIEAAAMLLNIRWRRQSTTIPKSLVEEPDHDGSWLEERDSEGQTPLMRSAAPGSKRMSTIRDLLRKNLWSLGARPAEMALFLISVGANWRETDTIYGMNLLHLAIVNNHDDIVNMLMVIDKQLVAIAAQMKRDTRSPPAAVDKSADFVSIDLTSDADEDSTERRPLIDDRQLKQETAQSLAIKGLMPLQLAIVYERITMISLLWRTNFELQMSAPMSLSSNSGRKQMKKILVSQEELKAILIRVFWSSQKELIKLIRVTALKVALVIDLTLLALLWMPTYLHGSNLAVFVVSSSLTLALTLRVIYKDPGYLVKESPDYYKEIEQIVDAARKKKEKQPSTSFNQSMDMRKRVRLLCHKCRCIRSPRSRHCNYCDCCVQDFDHHCIYLGCCIGRFNRLDFLLMLILLTITAIYGTIAMDFKTRSTQARFWHFIGTIWIAKYILIGTLSVLLNIRRACLGVTMYESMRSRRIRNTKDLIRRNQMIEDTYWRYTPNRFVTGDLPAKSIIKNLSEFAHMRTRNDYLLALTCSDSSLARSIRF